VAVLSLTDYPAAPGSGELAAGTLEKYLLWAGYSVIERRQVQQILNEQSFQASDAVDPAAIRKVGRLLGVDALVLGDLTDYADAREQTVMVDEPQENTEPIYGTVETTQRSQGTVVRTSQQVVTGYQTTTTDQVVPEVETLPAHVGMSVRLVDVGTAEVLWSASDSSQGADPAAATEQASAALMQGVAKQLKKSAPKPR
jgi:curli biogenesis system outer membrane secretion channel CsgG